MVLLLLLLLMGIGCGVICTVILGTFTSFICGVGGGRDVGCDCVDPGPLLSILL